MTGDSIASVEEHRDDLEALADSDNPAAWVAAELLEAVESNRGDGG